MAIAHKLVAGGFHVIAIARSEGALFSDSVTGTPGTSPGRLTFRAFDLGETGELASLIAGITSEFGPIYGLINNAGIGTPGVLANMPEAQIERLIRLNVLSPITLTKYAVRSMMVGGAGRIVNVSSIVASTGYSGLSVYSATKAATEGLTRSLARELGPLGINVNAVAPGFVATDMTHGMSEAHFAKIIGRSALRRLPLAGDIADGVAFLLSDGARNITGITLTVDAGNTV